ncbi:tyrosine-type recombinase/integrase [Streptomyces collinus]|uniref:tyrosine-type recombinase/integrase n=1 Tax=Streptomyces collinus TaxID=42684 RepID=UPI00364DA763
MAPLVELVPAVTKRWLEWACGCIWGSRSHKLRHTAASLAIASGADVNVVQTMLGHKPATLTLDTYGRRRRRPARPQRQWPSWKTMPRDVCLTCAVYDTRGRFGGAVERLMLSGC